MKLFSILAAAPAPTPQGDISTTILTLGGVAFLLSIALTAKKLFTRQPPIDQDLKKIQEDYDIKLSNVRKELLEMSQVNTKSHSEIYRSYQEADERIHQRVNRAMETIASLSASSEANARNTDKQLDRIQDEISELRKGQHP